MNIKYIILDDDNYYNYKGEIIRNVHTGLDESWKQEVGF